MKIFLNICSAASILGLLTIAASDLGLPVPVAVARKTEGSGVRLTGRPAPKASFAAPVVFNAHARSKVVQYFDTYRSEPLGLPPACAARIGAGGMPAGWGNPGIASGLMIPENERSFLIELPVELTRVLAVQSEVEVRYYLAGTSLVAVDAGYKVMDFVPIPTLRPGDGDGITRVDKPLLIVRRMAR